MIRERALKIVLLVVGLLFVAGIYPLIQMKQEEVLQMMLSVYVTLGVFLLLASRNPAANRSLIAFTAWSSLAHAGVMGAGNLQRERPRSPVRRRADPRHHWCRPDCSRPSQASGNSHFGGTHCMRRSKASAEEG